MQIFTWVENSLQASLVTAFIFEVTESGSVQIIFVTIHWVILFVEAVFAYICCKKDPADPNIKDEH